jgi:hypothetical protein
MYKKDLKLCCKWMTLWTNFMTFLSTKPIVIYSWSLFIEYFNMVGLGWIMVFNATFNNISVILWRPFLLVEESRVHGENHRPVASHWQTWSHNVVSSTPPNERGLNSQNSNMTHPMKQIQDIMFKQQILI